jgi:hypothetical protein
MTSFGEETDDLSPCPSPTKVSRRPQVMKLAWMRKTGVVSDVVRLKFLGGYYKVQ